MRILHCEDDEATAQAVDMMLQGEGFHVYATGSGAEAVELAQLYEYDLLLLDTTLPDMHGFDVLCALRDADVKLPCIVVSAAHDMRDKVRAFDLGADDYVTKPFHRDELVARVRAVVRRWHGHAASVLAVGPIEIDMALQQVRVGGEKMHLTAKEYQMLELLAMRRGSLITKGMFLNHLYGGLDEPCVKIIDVFICKLRKNLRDAGADGLIETVWGRGYSMRSEAVS